MNIVQQISDHPFNSLIKREVRLRHFIPQLGDANIKSGTLEYSQSSIRARFEVCEYILDGQEKKYLAIKDLSYECSASAKMNVVDLATGALEYITEPEAPGFSLMPSEKDFVLSLLLQTVTGTEMQNILKMFIYNMDTRSKGSVFNFYL